MFGGGTSYSGVIVPPNISISGRRSATRRHSCSQSGSGRTSSSVKMARSPSTWAIPVFCAIARPRRGSRTVVSGSLAANCSMIVGVASELALSTMMSFHPPAGGKTPQKASKVRPIVSEPLCVHIMTVSMGTDEHPGCFKNRSSRAWALYTQALCMS